MRQDKTITNSKLNVWIVIKTCGTQFGDVNYRDAKVINYVQIILFPNKKFLNKNKILIIMSNWSDD